MADRVVSYDFRGRFTNLTAGLTAAGKSVNDLGHKMTALDKNGAKMRAGLTTVGDAAGKMGLVAAAGVGAIILTTAKFDKAMSNVQAATHETAANMEELRAAAIKAGADTAFSASEAAAGIENLAKAGVATKDILGGGLAGALDLAAAGGIDVATAAEQAATAMTQFGLSGAQVPHIADLLAAGAGKAQGEVTDLGMALNQSGLVAAQMGVSIEETTGTLAAFASAGLIGSDAGTSLKTALLRLANPSAESAKLMKELGVSAYDATGKFVGMESLAGQLSTAFEGQTQAQRDAAMATIFGSDAIRAASILYSQGAEGVAGWTDKVNDAGYAAETAGIKLDNLAGDFEAFKGSLETALIGAGEGSQGPLRAVVQQATDAVNAFNKMPPAAQSSVTALLAVSAVTGGSLWLGATVVNKVAATRAALASLNATATVSRATLAGIGAGVSFAAIAGGIWAIDRALDAAFGTRDVDVNTLNRDLEALGGGNVLGNLDKMDTYLVSINSSFEHAQSVGFGWIPFADTSWQEANKNIGRVDEALAGLVESGHADQAAAAMAQITKMAGEQGISAAEATKWFDQYRTALGNAGDANTETAEAAGGLAAVTDVVTGAIEDETASIENNIKAMRAKRNATLAAFDAETAYRQALKAARKQGDKNNAGIKGDTDAALENRGVISSLAAAWNGQSEAVKNNVGKFKEARANFIETATAMGVPKKAAEALARELLEIPRSVVIKTEARTAEALAALGTLADFQFLDKYINVHTRNTGDPNGGVYASGGYTGPGAKYEARGVVHADEVVLPKEIVRRDASMLRARYGDLPGMANLPGYAAGGYVDRHAAGSYNSRPTYSAPATVEHVVTVRVTGDMDLSRAKAQIREIASDVSRGEVDADRSYRSTLDRQGVH